MAVGIRCIYEPLNLVTGGISGIAILIGHITEGIKEGGIPVWLTTAALNIPLFAAGWFVKGKEYIKRSLYGTVMFTVFLSLIPRVNLADQDYVLAAVIGGLITGCGLGLVFLTSFINRWNGSVKSDNKKILSAVFGQHYNIYHRLNNSCSRRGGIRL